MTDMIERVARAICAAHYTDLNCTPEVVRDHVDNEWIDWRPEAKAAIAALEESEDDTP